MTKEEVADLTYKLCELSNETGEFFSYMIDNDLLDLDSRNGKRGGGYCTFISNYKSPFIFANFNGTTADVDVIPNSLKITFVLNDSPACLLKNSTSISTITFLFRRPLPFPPFFDIRFEFIFG